jgi:hypothetical protein
VQPLFELKKGKEKTMINNKCNAFGKKSFFMVAIFSLLAFASVPAQAKVERVDINRAVNDIKAVVENTLHKVDDRVSELYNQLPPDVQKRTKKDFKSFHNDVQSLSDWARDRIDSIADSLRSRV